MYHLISYDLTLPGQDYPRIQQRIEALGGVRVVLSTWAIFDSRSPEDVWKDLSQYVDSTDRLLVATIDDWCGSNLIGYPSPAEAA